MIHEQVVAAPQIVSALDGVTVSYLVDEAEARQRLSAMVRAGGRVAIDIETAPHAADVEKLASLVKAREAASGKLRALKKLKAPADEIAALVAEGKQLAAAIKYAKSAGLDPRRARIRLLQVYDGGDRVLVIDLDRTGAGVLDLLEGVSVIAHNMGFEMAFLEMAGIALGAIHCTLQACRLMLGEHATSLADGAEAYLDLKLDKAEQTSNWNAPHLTKQQIEYAAIDAVVAWRIAEQDTAPSACAAGGLRNSDARRSRGHADGNARHPARRRCARAADRGLCSRSGSRASEQYRRGLPASGHAAPPTWRRRRRRRRRLCSNVC